MVWRQVAAEPEMAMLLSGFIYSSEGQEIYLRRPAHYNLPDKCLSFAEVGHTPYKEVVSLGLPGALAVGHRPSRQHPSQELIVGAAPCSTMKYCMSPHYVCVAQDNSACAAPDR